jgi:hypothetical protein
VRLKHLASFVVDGFGDHLIQRDFVKHIDLHKMQKVAQRNVHAEFFVSDQSDLVDVNGNPDSILHRVERVSKEVLDHQFLLEPFEEQYDLPALLVRQIQGRSATKMNPVMGG